MIVTREQALVRDAGGAELLERLLALDAPRTPVEASAPAAPDAGATLDYDVAFAGGGLSLLLVPGLARAGLRVAVFDRGTIGATHREWNASEAELQALVRAGLCTPEELAGLVVARYRVGTCRWHGGAVHPVTGVLDRAVDAAGLLGLARRRAVEAGAALFDRLEVVASAVGPHGVSLALRDGARARTVTAKLLVEARGAAVSGADLVCPTVGGVLEGATVGDAKDEYRPDVGEILASTEGVEEGRQHVWEAFPGRGDDLTVYLFHYAHRRALEPGELTRLYARFFETLPRYKRGAIRLLRPTFGLIPGWSRLTPPPAARLRTVLVGDAAARHSPLTFCGFGAMLRSLDPVTTALPALLHDEAALARPLPSLVHDTPLHRGTGALARMLASPPVDPSRRDALNELLDAAFASLVDAGDAFYGRLLRDELTLPQFVQFLRSTAARRPRVYREVLSALGPLALLRWGGSLALGRAA